MQIFVWQSLDFSSGDEGGGEEEEDDVEGRTGMEEEDEKDIIQKR